MTAFDYKKEYKEFYMPKNKPSIVTIPGMNYIAVRGHGDPRQTRRSQGLFGPCDGAAHHGRAATLRAKAKRHRRETDA